MISQGSLEEQNQEGCVCVCAHMHAQYVCRHAMLEEDLLGFLIG